MELKISHIPESMGHSCKYNVDRTRQNKPLISEKCFMSRDKYACEGTALGLNLKLGLLEDGLYRQAGVL